MASTTPGGARVSAWIQLHEQATALTCPRYEDLIGTAQNAQSHGVDADRVVNTLAELPIATPLRCRSNREKLRKVLLCLAAWNPRCGVNREFAAFVSSLMFVSDTESEIFELSVRIYRRLKLDDYFVDALREGGLRKDVALVIKMVEDALPDLFVSLVEHEAVGLLESVIETHLMSLTASGVRGSKRGVVGLMKMLDRVVTRWGQDSDPRRLLRWIVFCIICTHAASLQQAAVQGQISLLQAVAMSSRYRVNDALLAMIDAEVDAETCKRFHAIAFSLFGFGFGALLGVDAAHTITDTFSVSPLFDYVCSLLGGCAGATVLGDVGRRLGENRALAQTVEASNLVVERIDAPQVESDKSFTEEESELLLYQALGHEQATVLLEAVHQR
eukprot:TRINITY_DN8114_c0_g1_i1.p1 TRINITY_DN8114_c0_g1~~TRINITY_DN8114_c0_g1_i1.p1  ORF type:complete len:387 (+),score=41.28 TRINITY_DN8114_c0_g1_i1:39-1199(+)